MRAGSGEMGRDCGRRRASFVVEDLIACFAVVERGQRIHGDLGWSVRVCVRGMLFSVVLSISGSLTRFCYAAECPDSRPHRRVYHLSAHHTYTTAVDV